MLGEGLLQVMGFQVDCMFQDPGKGCRSWAFRSTDAARLLDKLRVRYKPRAYEVGPDD
jgi:hypothetical protein